jgi:2-dehydropantoate 2-reductase
VRPPVLVIGAGAVGCLVAARLATRCEVHLCARPGTAAAIAAAGGIRIAGRLAGTYPVRVQSRLVVPPGSMVFVAVKAYDLEALLRAHRRRLQRAASIVLLQNGLGIATRAREWLGRPVTRGVTSLAATRVGPGRVRCIATGPTVFPRGLQLERLWTAAGLPAFGCRDLRPHVWRKAAVNAVVNPLSALFGVENGRLLPLEHSPRLLVEEILAVARAYGQSLPPRATLAHVRDSLRRTAHNTSSMLQDVRAGNPTEIEWLNGAVVRLGAARGVPAPCNAAVAELVRMRTAGGTPARRTRRP